MTHDNINLGNPSGFVDQFGHPYGVRETNNQPHVVLADANAALLGISGNPLFIRGAGCVSVNNSSTAVLANGAVFTGVADNITDYSSIIVAVFTDQSSALDGLSLQFSQDGTNWDHTENHNIVANTEFTVGAMGEAQWFRIVYTNGAVTQGIFRLQVIYRNVPVVGEVGELEQPITGSSDAMVVRAILAGEKPNGDYTNVQTTAGGNTKVSLEEFDEAFNNLPLPVNPGLAKTAFGELLVGQLHPQFQGSFEYTVDNNDLNTNTVVSGGTVTQASAMAVMTTSTTTASSALFQSKQHAKYRPGLGGDSRFTALFTTPVAATEQYIGVMDETGSSAAFKNGYGVGYDGLTFGAQRWQNDALITVALADCDDPLDGTGASGMTIDQTKINVFEIRFQYLGVGAIEYCIEDDSTGRFVTFHKVLYANNNTEPSVHNPNFHHTMWVANKGTTSNIIMKSASYAFFVEGKTSLIELHQPENASGTKEKTTVTTEVAIFTIRNKATYASKTNFIDILLLGGGASIEASSANNLGSMRIVKNAILGGTPSYSDINTTDSVVEIDTSGTDLTGGKELGAGFLAGKNAGFRISLIDNKIILNPGDTLTFAGTSANSATIDAQTSWRELF